MKKRHFQKISNQQSFWRVQNSKDGIADVSYEALKLGPGEQERLTHYNNRVLSEYEYWSKILNEVDGGEDTTYVTPENVNNLDNNIDAGDVPGGNNNPSYDNNPFYNGDSPNTDKPNVPSNVNDRNNNNHISDDFNDDVINPGDEPIDNPTEVENPGDDYVEESGSNTNGNPGDESTLNPYHYDETQKINGTRIDDGGVSDYKEGMSLPDTKQNDITSNTDSGSVNTNSFGGESSIAVNTTANSPSNTGEDSAASSEKSSTSSNVESVGSDNPASANSVSKAYEILENFVKNPQNLMLSFVLVFIVLALLVVGYKRKSKEDEY